MSNIDDGQMKKVQSLGELFPLKPYDVQVKIASSIYDTLQKQSKKLMIIQSPTGTGKSYSLLVPIVAWINQNKFKTKQKQQPQISSTKIPSFLLKKQNTQESITENLKKQKQKVLSQIVDIEEIANLARFKIKVKQNDHAQSKEQMDVDELEENDKKYDVKRKISKEEMFVERQVNLARKDVAVKLIFVSRTHSQLEQIVDSLNKILPKLDAIQGNSSLMALSLGSKQHLCCNPQITKSTLSQQAQSISQKCQHLLTTSSCPFTHRYLIRQYFNKSIKQATSLSSQYKLCGYYSLRNSIQCADILLMPYASLVNKEIRSNIGVNVNNSIIVFDEGHNLVDFIRNSESEEIWHSQIIVLIDKIQFYLAKYGHKMKCSNKTLLSHFICVLRSIAKVMETFYHQKLSKCMQQTYIKMTMIQLILQLDLTDIRLHKVKQLFTLLDYDKKLAFFQPQPKLKTHQKQSNPQGNHSKSISVADIHRIINWIETLYRSDQSQMTVFVKSNSQSNQKSIQNVSIKLYCLYSNQLQELIEASRLTIIAGGTMQPLSDLEHITGKIPTQILKMPHIIKPDHCSIKCVLNYQKNQIKFNYENTNSQAGCKFLQQVILATLKKVVQKTPQEQGIIAFIQSYRLLEQIKQTLKSEKFFKDILFDSKNSRNENIFQIHTQRISSKQRSILFSVMGGKLSEGINFSDDLARKLIVFGLPYPSVKSPQIQEQMKYYDDLKLSNVNGQKYYESLCLKTINQAIGRGIRHKDDWAEIFLVDHRFLSVKNSLADWMKPSISVVQSLESL